MARQLTGAGKAASTKQPQTFFLLLQNLAVLVSNFESIQQSSVPSRIRPIFSKAACLASVPWSVYTEGGKWEILQWGEMQGRLLPKYVVMWGFCWGGGERVCVDFCFEG